MMTLRSLFRVISREYNLAVASGAASTVRLITSSSRMSYSQIKPLVNTADGPVRGRIQTSILGGQYYSFQGIPYAAPPVGPLRFQVNALIQELYSGSPF